MFQNGPRLGNSSFNDSQAQQEQRRDQQAQDAASEAHQRMMSEAQHRSFELQRQNIEGRVDEVSVKEQQGASSQQVADEAKQNSLGQLDYDLSRLTPPSLVQDKRGEIRHAFMRAVEARTKEIEAKRVESDVKEHVEERSRVEMERREREISLRE